MLSIIVPTYQEAESITALVERLAKVDWQETLFEVLIVDDHSGDDIDSIILELSEPYPWLRLIKRYKDRGLSQAVLEGIQAACYPNIVVMDADLSHPPETVPTLLSVLQRPGVDMVIGSRYIPGGSTDEVWPWYRLWISHLALWSARCIAAPGIKDPLSGFFAVRKETCLRGAPLQPIGWKISLEIIVKCHCKSIVEVPIYFSNRKQGASKLSLRVAKEYCNHLWHLAKFKLTETFHTSRNTS